MGTPNSAHFIFFTGWRVASESMKHLNTEARALRHEYRKSVFGVKIQKPLWKECVSTTGFNSYSASNFVYAASSMYALRYFKPEDKAQMFEMTEYLRKAFSEMVNELDWMDENTKVSTAQCGNLRIFLSLRFYVNSILQLLMNFINFLKPY